MSTAERREAGEAVQILDFKNRILGTAHYSSSSQITLRLLSTKAEEINSSFLADRLRAAIELRDRVVSDSDAYRLVYSEGDRLPALIVDRYGDYLSMQTLNQGMDRLRLISFLAWKSCLRRRVSLRAMT